MHNISSVSKQDAAAFRQDSYTREELIACAEGELFGPNTPRLPLAPMRGTNATLVFQRC